MKALLVQKVAEWADRNYVLLPETTVVAGVSGGADSVCLLHVLLELSKHRSFSVFAVHINHMLRGAESDEDEAFVTELCSRWQVPLRVFRQDVAALSEKNGCSVEEAGRKVRYECFYQVLQETGARYAAVAHHRGDQAETVFLHLLRGSGLEGLCGMEDISQWVIRPFLEVGKDEILNHLAENNLQYRNDSSNQDNAYTRNVIRNELLPFIEKQTGFPVSEALLRAARLLRQDRDYLHQMALRHYQELLIPCEDGMIIFNRRGLNVLHPSMATRCIRMAWEQLKGSLLGLEEKHITAVLGLSQKKASGKTIDLPGGVRCLAEYDRLVLLSRKQSQEENFIDQSLPVPGTVELGGIRIITRLYTRDEYTASFGNPEKPGETSPEQIFDYGRINKGINIRTRQDGDIFFPYRSPGSKKLKEFFIDEKIPRQQRENIPLLAVGKNILWVMGLRTAENFCIRDTTEVILSVRAVPLSLSDTTQKYLTISRSSEGCHKRHS